MKTCNECWWWESPEDFCERNNWSPSMDDEELGVCHLSPRGDPKPSHDWCSHHLDRADTEKRIENEKAMGGLIDSFLEGEKFNG